MKEIEEKVEENLESNQETQEQQDNKTKSVFDTSVFQEVPDIQLPNNIIVEDNIIPEQTEEEEPEEFSIQNYNFAGKVMIGVLDTFVILAAWMYARTQIENIQYKEIQGIIGLKETEKTELGRLVGRILAKHRWILTEEILFIVALVRIYSLSKIPMMIEYLKNNTKKKTKKRTVAKTKKTKEKGKKEEISVKDVLEEIQAG